MLPYTTFRYPGDILCEEPKFFWKLKLFIRKVVCYHEYHRLLNYGQTFICSYVKRITKLS